MPDEITKMVREGIDEQLAKIKGYKLLLARLKATGESTMELEQQLKNTELKLKRYKKAFAE